LVTIRHQNPSGISRIRQDMIVGKSPLSV
jgi:hypothetical protein